MKKGLFSLKIALLLGLMAAVSCAEEGQSETNLRSAESSVVVSEGQGLCSLPNKQEDVSLGSVADLKAAMPGYVEILESAAVYDPVPEVAALKDSLQEIYKDIGGEGSKDLQFLVRALEVSKVAQGYREFANRSREERKGTETGGDGKVSDSYVIALDREAQLEAAARVGERIEHVVWLILLQYDLDLNERLLEAEYRNGAVGRSDNRLRTFAADLLRLLEDMGPNLFAAEHVDRLRQLAQTCATIENQLSAK